MKMKQFYTINKNLNFISSFKELELSEARQKRVHEYEDGVMIARVVSFCD